MRKGEIISIILFAIIFSACDNWAQKDTSLGNNFILSEYSTKERAVYYSQNGQITGSREIIPMTVMEIGYDDDWIIAKSDGNHAPYWIIKKHFNPSENRDSICLYFYDYKKFMNNIKSRNIHLHLKRIDN